LFLSAISSYGQTVSQSYYDKCTKELKVFIIPLQGATIITFYNRTKSVTASDVTSGALQSWLEETYQWWTTYNPCSVAQTTQTIAQQTASSAVTNSISVTSSNLDISSSKTETPTVSETSSSESSSSKSESSSSKSEEKKEESKSESKKEEKKEEKKKQQALQPILISANYMTMQNLDGSFNQVASFGLSKSSLTGGASYNINSMIWSNLKQFSLSLSKTEIIFNHDKKLPIKVGKEILGYIYVKGSVYKITGLNATLMLMFDTKILSLGMNDVFLLKKGMVFGYAFGGTFVNVEKDVISSLSATFFTTRPFPFKRVVISPLVAISSSPIQYTTLANEFSYSEYFTYILGSNFDFNLTQRFKANLGVNTISNTNKNIPMTYAITIGSKIKL